MKNKTTLAQGIIICAQSILLDAFALYAGIPLLGNLWFGDLYGDEKSVAIFSLLIWLGISIGASIALNIGKKKIFNYFSYSPETNTYTANTYTPPIFKDSNTPTSTPSAGEWKCPKCGKINQNYIGTCGCGEVKPK